MAASGPRTVWDLWVEGCSQEGSLLLDMLIFNLLGAGQSQQPPGCRGDKVNAWPSQSPPRAGVLSHKDTGSATCQQAETYRLNATVRSLRGTASSWYLRQIKNYSEVLAASNQTRVQRYQMVLSLPQAMSRAEVPCLFCDGQEKYLAHLPLCFPTGVEGKVWKGRCREPQLQPPVLSSTEPRWQDGHHPVTHPHGHLHRQGMKEDAQ